MFFLLRIAFWLTIVLALLPSSSGTQPGAQAKVAAADAMTVAGAVVADMSNFCSRQPDACIAGAQAAVAIGQRAQAGAKMVYDFVGEHALRGDADRGNDRTGSVSIRKLVAVGAVPTSQNTLKPSDLEPAWQGPPVHTETVPLPRRNPLRKA